MIGFFDRYWGVFRGKRPVRSAWAQRHACEILARAYRVLGNQDESFRYSKLAEDWNRRLTLPPTPAPQTPD